MCAHSFFLLTTFNFNIRKKCSHILSIVWRYVGLSGVSHWTNIDPVWLIMAPSCGVFLRTRACYSPVTVTVIFRMLESNMARFLRPSIRSFVTSQLRMSSDQVIISWKRFRSLKWIYFLLMCVNVFNQIPKAVWCLHYCVKLIPHGSCFTEQLRRWIELFLSLLLHYVVTKSFSYVPGVFSKQRSRFRPFSFRLT